MERKYLNLRILIVLALFCGLFMIAGYRAVQLQVFQSEFLAGKAQRQYDRVVTSSGKRGVIFDTNMNLLASSVSVTSVAVRPQQMDEAAKKTNAGLLAEALEIDAAEALKKMNQNGGFVWLKRKIGPPQAAAMRALKLKGVELIQEYDRFYPNKSIAAQTIGFTSIDGKGIEGIEFYCDAFLTPAPASTRVTRDANGNILRHFTTGEEDAETEMTGHNVVLTLDKNIQYIAEEVLADTLEKFQAKGAMAIVMNPQTGAILAMAQAPVFNPNNLQNTDRAHWRNRNVSDRFEAGSVMKIFTVAAALESGMVSPSTQYYCENGAYAVGRKIVRDTKKMGTLTLQEIMKVSSNIGVIKMSEDIGKDILYAGLKNFGFGEKTGVECPGETSGYLSDPKIWSRIDTAAISFGHGMSVTPLQIATATCAIANGGMLMKPYLVKAIVDDNGEVVKEFKPVARQRAVSSQTAAMMNMILQTVTEQGGTGVSAAIKGYNVAGKTGTANKPETGGYGTRYISSFVGFAPAKNPAVVVLVMVDEPTSGGYYAATVAAPAFNRIMQKTLYYLHIVPKYGFDGDMQVARQQGD